MLTINADDHRLMFRIHKPDPVCGHYEQYKRVRLRLPVVQDQHLTRLVETPYQNPVANLLGRQRYRGCRGSIEVNSCGIDGFSPLRLSINWGQRFIDGSYEFVPEQTARRE